MSDKNNSKVFYMLMFLAMLSWGGSWTSAKLIAGYTDPEVLVFWRLLVTFISFVPVIIVIKTSFRLDQRSLLLIIISSALLVAYNKLFFLGLQTGLAGAGGVLVTTLIPVYTFLFTVIFFKHKPKSREVSGLILGFLGGLIMLKIWKFDIDQLYLSGNLFFLLAAMLWALLTITAQKAQEKVSPMLVSFYLYGLSTIMDFFIALPYDILGVPAFDGKFWWNLIFLSVIVTTFGTTAYFFAAAKLGANKGSSFTFLVPVSALIFSWVLIGEKPESTTILGGLLAMLAVYLITSEKTSNP